MTMNTGIESLSAVMQTSRNELTTSEKYTFIPTMRVVNVLQDNGWMPEKAFQARTLKLENRGFQKHVIRFRNRSLPFIEGHNAEIVLINSHMGSASFRLMLGVFRLICSNGLIVGDSVADYRITHKGYADDAINDAVRSLMLDAPGTASTIDKYQGIMLDQPRQLAYAKAAIELKQDSATSVYQLNPAELIRPYRQEEKTPTLWQTFNTVQERLVKGLYRTTNELGQRTKARAIKSIDKDTNLNRALWKLTEEMAKLAA